MGGHPPSTIHLVALKPERMDIRSFLKNLMPPLLLRGLRRVMGSKAPVSPTHQLGPEWCTVAAGPGAGLRLRINTAAPAFAAMAAGRYDDFLHEAAGRIAVGEGLVLDIGAHIGYHSLVFARHWPGCRVAAFEPNAANAARIAEHLAANPGEAARIEVFPVALADREGALPFAANDRVDDETSSGGYLTDGYRPLPTAEYERAAYAARVVPVRTLDKLAAERGWDAIALLKIDVEGAEHLVLRGARHVLAEQRPAVLIEVHGVVCMLHVLEELLPMGYRLKLLKEEGPSRCFIAAWPA